MARRDTRELILTTSLELFNSYGEPNVTTNHIADEADISPGNLYYHFRSKDDIVIELFKRFLVRFQPLIEVSDELLLQAEDLWFQLHLSFELKGEFRFLYRNLSDLTARIPDLDKAMRGLLKRERQSAWNSLGALEQAGVLSIDPLTERHADRQCFAGPDLLDSICRIVRSRTDMEDSTAQTRAIARALLSVTPHFREPEKSQFTELAYQYLSTIRIKKGRRGAGLKRDIREP